MNRIYFETNDRYVARARQLRAEAMQDLLAGLRAWFVGLFAAKPETAAAHGFRNLGHLQPE